MKVIVELDFPSPPSQRGMEEIEDAVRALRAEIGHLAPVAIIRIVSEKRV